MKHLYRTLVTHTLLLGSIAAFSQTTFQRPPLEIDTVKFEVRPIYSSETPSHLKGYRLWGKTNMPPNTGWIAYTFKEKKNGHFKGKKEYFYTPSVSKRVQFIGNEKNTIYNALHTLYPNFNSFATTQILRIPVVMGHIEQLEERVDNDFKEIIVHEDYPEEAYPHLPFEKHN